MLDRGSCDHSDNFLASWLVRSLRILTLENHLKHLSYVLFASGGTFEDMTDTANAPLTGKALLQKVKDLSNLSPREKARRCGYQTIGKNNQARVNLADFYEALLAARGISLGKEGEKDGRGREPTYRVSVHKNGQIVIGSTYTEKMGLKPGDEFEIKLGYKHIKLVKLDKDKDDSYEKNGSGK